MDLAQITLFIVIVVLAILLLVLGVQVFFILKEFRKTVSKANKVLDNVGIVAQVVSAPISSLSGIAAGIKKGTALISFLKNILSSNKEEWKKTGKGLLKAISENGVDNISNILEEVDEAQRKKIAPKRKFTIKETFAKENPKVRRFFRGVPRHLN